MAFSLRCAEPADVDALTRCIELAYAVYAAKGIDLPSVCDGLAEDIRDNIVWVAVGDGEILGGVILTIAGETAYLMNVAVDPNQSGRGIGRALIDAALTSAREADHRTIKLTTHKDMPRNVALYQHLGWVESGREGDKVFMTLQLDEAST